ncbi:MAG: hypothetical protein H6513_19565 [Acidimicrobiaceae bacterium]|nr:hypothetical protein [Acidimicrobiaceae bacterium]
MAPSLAAAGHAGCGACAQRCAGADGRSRVGRLHAGGRVAASTRAGPTPSSPPASARCPAGCTAARACGSGASSSRLTGPAPPAVDGALQRYGRLPGFGQVIYPDGDPRTPVLRALVDEAWPSSPALVTVDEVAAEARRRHAAPPNVDFALATLGRAAAMADDAAEAIFAVARIAGWLAHALEEYDERPLRFRPKATYIGR